MKKLTGQVRTSARFYMEKGYLCRKNGQNKEASDILMEILPCFKGWVAIECALWL